MSKFVVTRADDGRRLDVVTAELAVVSRSRVQQWLYEGTLTVNGRSARPSMIVVPGDKIDIRASVASPSPAKPMTGVSLPIIFEDSDILVVDKPAGLAVHPTSPSDHQLTVADFARTRTSDPDADRPGIVHRLDRDTSGLLIVAKHPLAKAYLQQQFAARKVTKVYQALVIGRLDPLEAVIKLPIGRPRTDPTRRAVTASGRAAETAYRTLAAYSGYSLVDARPRTGRTHQLRVHFAALGHPIAGDTRYGQPRPPTGLSRQFLHAVAIEFEAPSGKRLSLQSALPDDLGQFLAGLDAEARA